MRGASRKLRVLVVDDERFVIRALQRGLKDTADVTACVSVDEALALLAVDHAFDVVLSDLGLEGRTGMDLFHALEGEHPHLRRRFILMTGGYATDEYGVEILSKPFDLRETRDLIARVAAEADASNETR